MAQSNRICGLVYRFLWEMAHSYGELGSKKRYPETMVEINTLIEGAVLLKYMHKAMQLTVL